MNPDDPVHTSEEVPQQLPQRAWWRARQFVLGGARDFQDPRVRRHIALMAFLAWVGLGADGLSSSAYGPPEAFSAVGEHVYLAVFLALATALTVFIISFAYSRIIEHFPTGGGGYIVATQLLGRSAGVVSGSALLVDYVLTISVSIASGGDAVFSLLPAGWHHFKLETEFVAIIVLVMLNLRGVKESVTAIIPIFMTFVITHALLIGGVLGLHLPAFGGLATSVKGGLHQDLQQLGAWVLFLLFLRAYSLGAGTYTGIEAVSNGLGIMREPRVETGKRTMLYMAVSLAVTAAGLLICYMLMHVRPSDDPNQTLNTLLARRFAEGFRPGGIGVGHAFVWITIASEAVLLFVAAQTGFIDGPRVMANMALDNWMPRRFASLSDRLTTQNGVLLMGIAAALTLAYTRGQIGILVVMYSINVFLTFSLSESGMVRFWVRHRRSERYWKRNISIHAIGWVLCVSILCVMLSEKLREGGWITVAVTVGLIGVCWAIRSHYAAVSESIREVDRTFASLPNRLVGPIATQPPDAEAPTAVLLVGGYGGLGIHMLMSVQRLFPDTFKNVVFASIGVLDSNFFQKEDAVEELRAQTARMLDRYVDVARRMGKPSTARFRMGTDVVEEASKLCMDLAKDFPRAVFFAGTLAFEQPHWYHRMLHNETAYAIQRRLKSAGVPMVILPLLLRLPKGN